jgi:hypothetical protein
VTDEPLPFPFVARFDAALTDSTPVDAAALTD